MNWLFALLYSIVFSYVAYRLGALSRSGLLGAVFVGTAIMGGLGWSGIALLSIFFVSSSAISRWSTWKSKQHQQQEEVGAKGERRDIIQVMANGGIASLCALLYFLTEEHVWINAFCVSLAAATSDTWASEIGRWSKQKPRDCFTWQEVEAGTSGAISVLGTMASLGGAFIIGLASYFLFYSMNDPLPAVYLILLITIAGWLGNWLDTILGAKWQVLYQCSSCYIQTEQTFHCQKPTFTIKGYPWLNNDLVNLLANLGAVILALLIYGLLLLTIVF